MGVRTGFHGFFPGGQVAIEGLTKAITTPGTGLEFKEEALSRSDREGDGTVCQKKT